MPLLVSSGLSNSLCWVPPLAPAITASRPGSLPLLSWRSICRTGQGVNCPFKARRPLSTLLLCLRSGIYVMFSLSLSGQRKRINKAVWSFFWSGKRDLVARKAVCLPKSKGGFGVIDFQLKADAFALQWVKRFFASDRGKWKNFFTFFVLLRFGVTS